MHTRFAICLLIVALTGCQSAPESVDASPAESAQPIQPDVDSMPAIAPTVPADAFDAVFAASVDVLRDWRFVVNRKDRRQGIVSADPRVAASVVEPWQPDAGRSDHMWESTVNYQRRRVRIEIAPTDPATVVESNGSAGPFQLNVVCELDRRYYPPRQLIDPAVTKVRFANSRDVRRPIRTEAGVQEAYWQGVGRDHAFESRLAQEILDRAAASVPAAEQ